MTPVDPWLFVSDVDDTLLGDDDSLAQLSQALQAVEQVIVAYNSSRPCASLRRTLAQTPHLLTPDYLIGAMGTEIQEGATGKPIPGFLQQLGRGWQRDRISAMMDVMGFKAHADEYQTPFKASYNVPNAASYTQVKHRLEAANIKAKIIFSGGKNLDIIPEIAGKGAVIAHLQAWLQILPERVVVSGDSGNDLEMFEAGYRGIVVGNAAPELKELEGSHVYQAHSVYAAGVLEGLRYWGVL